MLCCLSSRRLDRPERCEKGEKCRTSCKEEDEEGHHRDPPGEGSSVIGGLYIQLQFTVTQQYKNLAGLAPFALSLVFVISKIQHFLDFLNT